MSKQHLSDPSKGKYFTQILNMADDDLGPYEMRLLIRYTRVAWKTGKCWEGIRKTAQVTQMSVGMVTKTRNRLVELGYIKVKHRQDDTCVIVIVDRMAENVARYAAQDVEDEDEFDVPSGKRSHSDTGVHQTRQGVHHMNTSELEGVHHMNERIIEPKDKEPSKKENTTTSVPVGTQAGVSSEDPYPIALEADDPAMFPAPSEKQKSARADNSAKRLSKTATTAPNPVAPAPSPVEAAATDDAVKPKKARKPNRMAQIIDGVWGKGVSGGLLPMLMGHSKKPTFKDHNIEGGMTEQEIFAFGRWYRRQSPGLSLPEIPFKVEAAIESFRNAVDYEQWMREAQHQVLNFFPKDTDTPVTPPEELATAEDLEAFRQELINGPLGDVLGHFFKDQTS